MELDALEGERKPHLVVTAAACVTEAQALRPPEASIGDELPDRSEHREDVHEIPFEHEWKETLGRPLDIGPRYEVRDFAPRLLVECREVDIAKDHGLVVRIGELALEPGSEPPVVLVEEGCEASARLLQRPFSCSGHSAVRHLHEPKPRLTARPVLENLHRAVG